MMAHADECRCYACTAVIADAVEILPVDREIFAQVWERWHSSTDGEAAKLRRGENGNPGSPRWIALQGIARSRMAGAGAQP